MNQDQIKYAQEKIKQLSSLLYDEACSKNEHQVESYWRAHITSPFHINDILTRNSCVLISEETTVHSLIHSMLTFAQSSYNDWSAFRSKLEYAKDNGKIKIEAYKLNRVLFLVDKVISMYENEPEKLENGSVTIDGAVELDTGCGICDLFYTCSWDENLRPIHHVPYLYKSLILKTEDSCWVAGQEEYQLENLWTGDSAHKLRIEHLKNIAVFMQSIYEPV